MSSVGHDNAAVGIWTRDLVIVKSSTPSNRHRATQKCIYVKSHIQKNTDKFIVLYMVVIISCNERVQKWFSFTSMTARRYDGKHSELGLAIVLRWPQSTPPPPPHTHTFLPCDHSELGLASLELTTVHASAPPPRTLSCHVIIANWV